MFFFREYNKKITVMYLNINSLKILNILKTKNLRKNLKDN